MKLASDPFTTDVVELHSALGRLTFGIVDPHAPGIADGVSKLLMRSIQDARAERGGHLPSWLVDDIERNYISPEKVRTLWAATGHRFALFLEGELVGTVHVAREHDVILTVDRVRLNVPARDYPGFKPERTHHVVNMSVKHELRRARLGRAMFDAIVRDFRARFSGDGLWVRADPPWHAGLVGLGFVHDPSMDVFLPSSAERTAGLTHDAFNARYTCDCPHPATASTEVITRRGAAMQSQKLQYVSFTRPFDPPVAEKARRPIPELEERTPRGEAAVDWGRVVHASPTRVVEPSSIEALARVLAEATRTKRSVSVRGGGFSAAGQSLGGELSISTAGLNAIVAIGETTFTVQGGARWSDVMVVLEAHGVTPTVVTGFLPATVGGTLSTGGFSKGSHRHGFLVDEVRSLVVVTGDGRTVACSRTQARWLFDAVLGGFGQFGVIVEATFPLVPKPAERVLPSRRAVPSPSDLRDALLTSAARRDVLHVTAFAESATRWQVVTTAPTATDEPGSVSYASYVNPPRREITPGPALWLNMFVPASAVAAYLDVLLPKLALADGDAVQVLPVRKLSRGTSWLRMPAVPDGEIVLAVCVTREIRTRDRVALEAANRSIRDAGLALGSTSALAGTLPETESEWRTHLGEAWDGLRRVKRLADPAGVLTSRAFR